LIKTLADLGALLYENVERLTGGCVLDGCVLDGCVLDGCVLVATEELPPIVPDG